MTFLSIVCDVPPHDQVLLLLSYLAAHVDTPGLFRTRVPSEALALLQRSLEGEAGVPAAIGNVADTAFVAHTAAQVRAPFPPLISKPQPHPT